MRISERDYDAFAEDRFPNMALVREWADCRIWSAGLEQPLLVLVDAGRMQVAVFEYDTAAERERDIQLVRHLKFGDGGAGKAVLAGLHPAPPSRPAQAEQAIPAEEQPER